MPPIFIPARSCEGRIVNLTLINPNDTDPLPPGMTLRVTHVVTSHRKGWVILAHDNGSQVRSFKAPAMLLLPVLPD